jgi:hypothetical protein
VFRWMVPLTTDWARLQGSHQKSHQSGRKRRQEESIMFPLYEGSWELGDSSSIPDEVRGVGGSLNPTHFFLMGVVMLNVCASPP